MDQKKQSIVPSPIYVDSFRLASLSVDINRQLANITIELFSENNFITTKYLLMTGDDYNNWTNDYPYIINYICNQLGFEIN